jgi:hypothetical protein
MEDACMRRLHEKAKKRHSPNLMAFMSGTDDANADWHFWNCGAQLAGVMEMLLRDVPASP